MKKLNELQEKKQHIDAKRKRLQAEMEELKQQIDQAAEAVAQDMTGKTDKREKEIEDLSRSLVNKATILEKITYDSLKPLINEIMAEIHESDSVATDAIINSKQKVLEAREAYNRAIAEQRHERSKAIAQHNKLCDEVASHLASVSPGINLKQYKLNANQHLTDLLRIMMDGGQARLVNH